MIHMFTYLTIDFMGFLFLLFPLFVNSRYKISKFAHGVFKKVY